MVVIDKPPHLLTIANAGERHRTAYRLLNDSLAEATRRAIFIVHRLDREASGLLVFAKTIEAKTLLQDQFKDHSAGRVYTALVEGRVNKKEFTLRSYLAENAAFRVYVTKNSKDGKAGVPAGAHVFDGVADFDDSLQAEKLRLHGDQHVVTRAECI